MRQALALKQIGQHSLRDQATLELPATPADAIDDPLSWEPSATFLKVSLAALLCGAAAYLVLVLTAAPDQRTRLIGPALVVLVTAAAWVLVRRGRMYAATQVLAVGCWIIATGLSVFHGGVRTPIVAVYPLIVVLVGWLLGMRAALGVGGLTVAVLVGFVVAESIGVLPVQPLTLPAMYGVVQVLVVALATTLIVLLVRSYHNRLRELGRVGNALALRTRELESNRAELHRAQAVARVGSWSFDIAADLMQLSAETCRIFGLPAGTTGSHGSYLARTHDSDRSSVDAAWSRALAGGNFDHEQRITVGAEVRWVRQRAEFEFAPDGSAVRAFGVTQDITDRKQAEATVLATRNRLQATLNALPDLLFEADVEGRIHDAHTHRSDLLAVPPEQFLGRLFSDFLPADATRTCLAALQLADQTGWSNGAQYALMLPQGQRWFELSVARMSAGADVERRFILIARDITKRKQAEERLQLSSSVFTHSREGIMIAAADGTIIDVNEAFTRITGYGREEVLDRNPRVLNSGRHGKDFYAAMWRSLSDKGHWYGEIWNRRKNGEVYAEMQTISTVRGDDGEIRHFVSLFSDISALKAHEKQLEHIAHYDALTSLPNRVLLADRLHQSMAQALRRGQALAVAFLDLDGFKSVNDRYGHEAGDACLIDVADRMKQALRDGDTLARIGGDEFVVVLVDLPDRGSSIALLDRLLAAVAQPVQAELGLVQVSASLGVTFFPQQQLVDADHLLRQADQAMYQAKLAGKNRYHVFDAELDSSVRGRHADLQRVRQGLAEGEFVLHYQPKVNMRTGAIVGAEALIRWAHPERGLLPPTAFLPLIEDHALDIEIGEWAIDAALGQVQAWRDHGLDLPVSVNVGALQLQQPDFVDRLRELLGAHPGVPASSLEIEVLESSALEDVARVSRVIEACREMGVLFALDDFGTGYSSLTYLKRLPVAFLKIDRSFVHDMLDDSDDLAILEGVIGLAAAFHRQVIAEGVETREHGELLLQLGCELAQGFGIARPMPAHQMPAWARAWRPDPAWAGLPAVNRRDLALLFATVEQRAWLVTLTAFLQGTGEAPPSLDPCHSRLGAWLTGKGRLRHSQREAFASIEILHRRLHTLARQLCEKHAKGQVLQAQEGLVELQGLHGAMLAQLKGLSQADLHETAATA